MHIIKRFGLHLTVGHLNDFQINFNLSYKNWLISREIGRFKSLKLQTYLKINEIIY